MTETHETPAAAHGDKPSYDDINTPVVILVGLISCVVTVLLIFLIEGAYYQWRRQVVEERVYAVENRPVLEQIEMQRANLEADPGTKRISIGEAMDKVVEKYSSKSDTRP